MIKIISGFSEKGGSTTAFINLTNIFNENGMDCIFYGPHDWHLNKCKSDKIQNAIFQEDDVVISHFLKLKERPKVRKVILSCHEKWWFDVGGIKQYWDLAVFLHQQHRDYHFKYKGDYVLIPNFKENLSPKEKPQFEKIAGVIGSIENRKQTHVSIERALRDGYEQVYVIGNIGDHQYYDHFVKNKIDNERVFLVPYQTNKQKMYDRLGAVYHSSTGEVACLVKDECYLTNTKFFGNEETENEVSTLNNNEILDIWKKVLDVQ